MATRTLIAIPSLDAMVPIQTLNLVARAVASGHACLTVPAAYPREYAKNLCVKMFAEAPEERLLIVDADMVPTWEAFEAVQALIDEGYDAAVARCLIGTKTEDKKGYAPTPAIYELVDGSYVPYDISEAGEVDGIGGAFTCYTRALLSDPKLHLDEAGAVFRNILEDDGKVRWSEDLDFSFRARELGYHLAATPERVGHLKVLDLDLVENSIERSG